MFQELLYLCGCECQIKIFQVFEVSDHILEKNPLKLSAPKLELEETEFLDITKKRNATAKIENKMVTESNKIQMSSI